ncbi:hypothetical protein SAMN04487891_10525 [Flagellimonas taeanensis]|uniref:Uncharacterized protein n=1 Tax=Flagellimonas taeanensis TaxID=1005926 RepID=A0A1I1G176_9FLAO|nr:hypothetical protein SAMN04487891_10525 [Allomuricauda taeanensis]
MLKSWVASDVSWVLKRRLCGKIFSVVGHNKKRPKSILDSILIGLVLFKEKYISLVILPKVRPVPVQPFYDPYLK